MSFGFQSQSRFCLIRIVEVYTFSKISLRFYTLPTSWQSAQPTLSRFLSHLLGRFCFSLEYQNLNHILNHLTSFEFSRKLNILVKINSRSIWAEYNLAVVAFTLKVQLAPHYSIAFTAMNLFSQVFIVYTDSLIDDIEPIKAFILLCASSNWLAIYLASSTMIAKQSNLISILCLSIVD